MPAPCAVLVDFYIKIVDFSCAADRAITELEERGDISLAAEILKAALLRAEDAYIETADEP